MSRDALDDLRGKIDVPVKMDVCRGDVQEVGLRGWVSDIASLTIMLYHCLNFELQVKSYLPDLMAAGDRFV